MYPQTIQTSLHEERKGREAQKISFCDRISDHECTSVVKNSPYSAIFATLV
jgi:hypothetical protein